jgi:ADP-ribose pyrophosphatase YjhB (NUDIX family)
MNVATTESQKFINLGIVKNNQGQILMIRRAKLEVGLDGQPLVWAFPGGKQRLNESRADGVKREVLAETGYDVRVVKELTLRHHPNFPVVVAYHLCELINPQPVALPSEPDEVTEVKWFTPPELIQLKLDLDPDVAKILR